MIGATILLGANAVLDAEQRSTPSVRLVGAYSCAALGVLAKGLIGVVLPAMVISIWLVWSRRFAGCAPSSGCRAWPSLHSRRALVCCHAGALP